MALTARLCDLEETLALRQKVLRPDMDFAQLRAWYGTRQGDGFSVGAFDGDALVTTVTFLAETTERLTGQGQWRLRAMATDPARRRQGGGGIAVRFGIDVVRQRGGQLIWLNGRTPAAGFYRGLGFEQTGQPFDTPPTGEHYLFVMPLTFP